MTNHKSKSKSGDTILNLSFLLEDKYGVPGIMLPSIHLAGCSPKVRSTKPCSRDQWTKGASRQSTGRWIQHQQKQL